MLHSSRLCHLDRNSSSQSDDLWSIGRRRVPHPNVAEMVRPILTLVCDVRVGTLTFPIWLVTAAGPPLRLLQRLGPTQPASRFSNRDRRPHCPHRPRDVKVDQHLRNGHLQNAALGTCSAFRGCLVHCKGQCPRPSSSRNRIAHPNFVDPRFHKVGRWNCGLKLRGTNKDRRSLRPIPKCNRSRNEV